MTIVGHGAVEVRVVVLAVKVRFSKTERSGIHGLKAYQFAAAVPDTLERHLVERQRVVNDFTNKLVKLIAVPRSGIAAVEDEVGDGRRDLAVLRIHLLLLTVLGLTANHEARRIAVGLRFSEVGYLVLTGLED